jgi:pantothenate synthetase
MVFAKENLSRINFPKLKEHISNDLKYNGFEKIDYVSICNGDTLEELESFDSLTPTIILIAAFIGGVRLIDNLTIDL